MNYVYKRCICDICGEHHFYIKFKWDNNECTENKICMDCLRKSLLQLKEIKEI